MKHFKNIFSKAKSINKEQLTSENISGQINKMASFLDDTPTPEQLKKQKHYENLKQQNKEADYESDWLSVKSVNNTDKDQQRTIKFDKENGQYKPYDMEKDNKHNNFNNKAYQQHSFTNESDLGKSSFTQEERQQYYSQNLHQEYQQQDQKQNLKESSLGKNQQQQEEPQQQQDYYKDVEQNDNLSMAEKLRMKFMGQPKQEQQQSQQQGSIPFMITRAMKIQLLDLGYQPDQIRSMTPQQAHEIITNKKENNQA